MRAALHVSLLAQAALIGAALGGESLRPTADFADMRVVVTYVSTLKLAQLRQRFGARIDLRDIRQDHLHGFSILKTHRETGALTCEIYLPSKQRPRAVDDEATLSLGHELLHCMLGDYHR